MFWSETKAGIEISKPAQLTRVIGSGDHAVDRLTDTDRGRECGVESVKADSDGPLGLPVELWWR